MSRRKLLLYGDADLDAEFDAHLRSHNWVNYRSVKDLGLENRPDEFHYREAFRRGRILVSHDEDYLNNSRYPINSTHGVIVLKRGREWTRSTAAFEKFIRSIWRSPFRESFNFPILGYVKVNVSNDGFHLFARTVEGQPTEQYYSFVPVSRQR